MLGEVVRHGQQRRGIVEQRRNVNGVISSIQQWQVLCTYVHFWCSNVALGFFDAQNRQIDANFDAESNIFQYLSPGNLYDVK